MTTYYLKSMAAFVMLGALVLLPDTALAGRDPESSALHNDRLIRLVPATRSVDKPCIMKMRDGKPCPMMQKDMIPPPEGMGMMTPPAGGPSPHGMMGRGMMPGAQGFMGAHDKMMAGQSSDTDADFVRGMIPFYQGSIDMAKVEMKYGKDRHVRKMAKHMLRNREHELTRMTKWLHEHENKTVK